MDSFQFRIQPTGLGNPQILLQNSVGNIRSAELSLDYVDHGEAYFNIINNQNESDTCDISLDGTHVYKKCDFSNNKYSDLMYAMIRYCLNNREAFLSSDLNISKDRNIKYNDILNHLESLLPENNRPTKSVNMARPKTPSSHAEGASSSPDHTNPSKGGGKRKKVSKKVSKKSRSNKKSHKRRSSAKRSRKNRRSSKNTKSKRKSRRYRRR
jgi:hypothetical protein